LDVSQADRAGTAWRRWSPAPLVRASLWTHGAAAAAALAHPALSAEMGALVAANHAVLGACMHPQGTLLGDNIRRLPEDAAGVALTFDDGPDPEVTPRVLDLLDAHGARASFFVIGERARAHPALVRDMLRRGHAVENHTQRHSPLFALRGPLALWRELRDAQDSIAAAGGILPRFFRAPMGLRSPLLDPVLALHGLSLVSWSRRGHDALKRDPAAALARLLRGIAPGDILLLHDGNCARDADGRPVVLSVLPRLLPALAARGLPVVPLSAPAVAPAAAAASAAAPPARAARA
jgi:peptidoglycan/xylan/chitin deacetylase (PgdA/CDA1 family)